MNTQQENTITKDEFNNFKINKYLSSNSGIEFLPLEDFEDLLVDIKFVAWREIIEIETDHEVDFDLFCGLSWFAESVYSKLIDYNNKVQDEDIVIQKNYILCLFSIDENNILKLIFLSSHHHVYDLEDRIKYMKLAHTFSGGDVGFVVTDCKEKRDIEYSELESILGGYVYPYILFGASRLQFESFEDYCEMQERLEEYTNESDA